MKEFDIIQTVFELITENVPEEFISFELIYFIESIVMENGEQFELGKFTGQYISAERKKRLFSGKLDRALFDIKEQLENLREMMEKKTQNQVKWNEIILAYEKGGEVKTRFSYPEPSECV